MMLDLRLSWLVALGALLLGLPVLAEEATPVYAHHNLYVCATDSKGF